MNYTLILIALLSSSLYVYFVIYTVFTLSFTKRDVIKSIRLSTTTVIVLLSISLSILYVGSIQPGVVSLWRPENIIDIFAALSFLIWLPLSEYGIHRTIFQKYREKFARSKHEFSRISIRDRKELLREWKKH